jgi:hypothetical protein
MYNPRLRNDFGEFIVDVDGHEPPLRRFTAYP